MGLVDREELGAKAEADNGDTNGIKLIPMLGRMGARPNLPACGHDFQPITGGYGVATLL